MRLDDFKLEDMNACNQNKLQIEQGKTGRERMQLGWTTYFAGAVRRMSAKRLHRPMEQSVSFAWNKGMGRPQQKEDPKHTENMNALPSSAS